MVLENSRTLKNGSTLIGFTIDIVSTVYKARAGSLQSRKKKHFRSAHRRAVVAVRSWKDHQLQSEIFNNNDFHFTHTKNISLLYLYFPDENSKFYDFSCFNFPSFIFWFSLDSTSLPSIRLILLSISYDSSVHFYL